MSTIILQRFANREYRLRNQSLLEPQKKFGDKSDSVKLERYAQAVHNTYVLPQQLESGTVADISDGDCRLSAFGEVEARRLLHSLDITDEFQPIAGIRTKGGQGALSRPTVFTRNARHRLLEAGAIVDKDCGRDAWEITLTLPGSTADAFRTCAAYSGWLINRLLRDVRKQKCSHWFYVWEWQKRGALHLHFLVAGKGTKTKAIAHSLEYQWWELLLELSEKTGVDMFRRDKNKTWKYESSAWQSHTAPIQKSVAAYFSKYAGKAQSKKSQGFTPHQYHCPSRWWGCSSHLKTRMIQETKTYRLNTSTSTSKEIQAHLQEWLANHNRIRAYSYEFQLGQTKNGTELGGGEVWINYYDDNGFSRMQSWEAYVWEEVLEIARRHGDADMDITQTWTDADKACKSPLYADMERRHDLDRTGGKTHGLPHPPHSQPPSLASKLRIARGTQAKPTLAIRALALQFLAGGGWGTPTKDPDCERPTEYIQGTLFDTNYYEGLTGIGSSYEI